MNPTAPNETSGMNLPAPMNEQAPPAVGPEVVPAVPEQAPAGAEKSPTQIPTDPLSLPTVPVPMPAGAQPQVAVAGSQNTQASAVPATTDDKDLIEKEWVMKAKAIIEQTKEDPYKQSKELNGLKADYMKQQYNKTIKLSE